MYNLQGKNINVTLDCEKGKIVSLVICGKERLNEEVPIFNIGLRKIDGESCVVSAFDARKMKIEGRDIVYKEFNIAEGDITVKVKPNIKSENIEWYIEVILCCEDILIEWVEFPLVNLPMLKANNDIGTGGEILLPFNEGCLISDIKCREENYFKHEQPEYPSKGSFSVFPNMLCSQLISYLWEDCGLYIGAHDPKRGVKFIDFFECNKGVTMQMRLYSGVNYGEDFILDYPIVWAVTAGNWESAAEIYRKWFESALPPKVKKYMKISVFPSGIKILPLFWLIL